MFAIVETSGRQFRVTEGDRIVVDRVAAKVGETVRLDSVLMVAGGADPAIGTPFIPGAAVEATVVAHRSGDKVIVFKYRPKKRERRKVGHRRLLSEIRIGAIRRPGQTESRSEEPTQSTPAPAARKRPVSRKEKGATHGT